MDLDWFDPAVLPGTGTPEPGGFHWQDFAAVIDVLQEHRLVAADVVELAPQLDTSGISSVLAAKVPAACCCCSDSVSRSASPGALLSQPLVLLQQQIKNQGRMTMDQRQKTGPIQPEQFQRSQGRASRL